MLQAKPRASCDGLWPSLSVSLHIGQASTDAANKHKAAALAARRPLTKHAPRSHYGRCGDESGGEGRKQRHIGTALGGFLAHESNQIKTDEQYHSDEIDEVPIETWGFDASWCCRSGAGADTDRRPGDGHQSAEDVQSCMPARK